jgi:hypothetical protein
MHLHPPLVVLTAVLAAWLCAAASNHSRVGGWAGAMVVGLMLVVHRTDTLTPGFEQVSALWSKRGGAACSWRLGETFLRRKGPDAAQSDSPDTPAPLHRDGQLVADEQDAIALCRSLSETAQVLDCIGGLAHELQFRSERVYGEPPSGLNGIERNAYAFYYGIHRDGRMAPCDDFREAALRRDCRTAVQLDCFTWLDIAARFAPGHRLGRPQCEIPAVPMDGYWAEVRSDLLSRPPGRGPEFPREFPKEGLEACSTVVDSCY